MPGPSGPSPDAFWSDGQTQNGVSQQTNEGEPAAGVAIHVEEAEETEERRGAWSSDEEVEDNFDVTLRTPTKPESLRIDRMRSIASAMTASPVPTSATALTTDDDRMLIDDADGPEAVSDSDDEDMSSATASGAESDNGSVRGKAVRRKRPLPVDAGKEHTITAQASTKTSTDTTAAKAPVREAAAARGRIARPPPRMARSASSSKSEADSPDHPMDGSGASGSQTHIAPKPTIGRKPAGKTGAAPNVPQAAKRRRVDGSNAPAPSRAAVSTRPMTSGTTAPPKPRPTTVRPKPTKTVSASQAATAAGGSVAGAGGAARRSAAAPVPSRVRPPAAATTNPSSAPDSAIGPSVPVSSGT